MHSQTPLVVCWGMGQDSTGMLVGMWERGIRTHGLIVIADAGSSSFEGDFRSQFENLHSHLIN